MTEWHWQQVGTAQWLTCELLSDWPHGFGCRRDGDPLRPPELASHLGLDGQPHWAYQVHGNGWDWADSTLTGSEATERLAADAVVTDVPGDSVWVCTADCVPIIVVGSQAEGSPEWVAAIHAGWRGTAAGILTEVIGHWLEKGIPPTSIRAALGPAISGPAYQVGADVAAQVLSTVDPEHHQDPRLVMSDPQAGKVRLDVRQANALQLQTLGIPASNISICPYCTYEDPEAFFSYRRDYDRRKSDVQWSGISPRFAET
ncbi:MAG: peptidoglycan editing factor PgeF [Cyanophyceae cyanobacterium]